MFDAQSVYGIPAQTPTYGVAAPTAHMGTDDLKVGWGALVDPHNPLFYFGIVLAVTFGAAGVAGHVRLGKAQLSASLDKS